MNFQPAKRKPKIPTVLSHSEAKVVINQLDGISNLAVRLMYGSGLRVSEAIRLRIKDIDFDHQGIYIMEAKGDKSRRTILPTSCVEDLKKQIEFVQHQVKADQILKKAGVYLPDALGRKFPTAEFDLKWQYIFPSHVQQPINNQS